MQYEVVSLAILTAVGWGASDPLSKMGMEHGGTPFQASLTVIFVSVVVYWGALLIQGLSPMALAPWVVGLFIVTGLVATSLARVLSYTGIQRAGASVSTATVNTRPVWATVMAVAFLGEAITAQAILGILFVVAGLIALAFSEGGDITGWNNVDLLFPLAAALIFAVGNVTRRFAFTETNTTALQGVAINETAGLVGLLVYLLYRHGNDFDSFLRAPKRAYAYFVGCGLLSAFSLFVLFAALSRGRVVIVDPLSSPTSLFAILFTALFLRGIEVITRQLIVGAVLVVVGVVLMTGPQFLVL